MMRRTSPTLQRRVAVVAADGSVTVPAFATFVRIESATGAFRVQIDDGEPFDCFAGFKYRTPAGIEVQRVGFTDESGAQNTLVYWVGWGDIDDTSTDVEIAPSSALASAADVTVTTAATAILASNAARIRALISNNDAAIAMRVGDSNVSASRGVRVPPGGAIVLETTAAVYAAAESSSLTAGVAAES